MNGGMDGRGLGLKRDRFLCWSVVFGLGVDGSAH